MPYGKTASYGDISQRLGLDRRGPRAVGAANGRNPIPIVVPCHRIIGADGSMTGYAGDLDKKMILLNLESPALFWLAPASHLLGLRSHLRCLMGYRHQASGEASGQACRTSGCHCGGRLKPRRFILS